MRPINGSTNQRQRALSLLQPWASLVVMGLKTIETRSWNTAYRGRLLIHASLGKSGALLAAQLPFIQHIPDFHALPFGAIIGEVSLVDTIRFGPADSLDASLADLTLEERAFGDYSTGRWGWILTGPLAYDEPVPATGRLGLWEF